MNSISQGESERRIDTSTKDQEPLVIGNMINTMLDNMDKNIRDIYQLQPEPKMPIWALQAQINPHLCANTAEFWSDEAAHENELRLAVPSCHGRRWTC